VTPILVETTEAKKGMSVEKVDWFQGGFEQGRRNRSTMYEQEGLEIIALSDLLLLSTH
jgi:hypothetical protein